MDPDRRPPRVVLDAETHPTPTHAPAAWPAEAGRRRGSRRRRWRPRGWRDGRMGRRLGGPGDTDVPLGDVKTTDLKSDLLDVPLGPTADLAFG